MSAILEHPDPLLRKVCRPVGSMDCEKAVQDMEQVLFDEDALGLAANQIGYDARIICVAKWCVHSNARVGCITMIDPCITSFEERDRVVTTRESCLSLPGVEVEVRRQANVRCRWRDVTGRERTDRFANRMAVVIQHEIDHLNGKLIIDHQDEGERS